MRILISNDDGINAGGIHALARAFCVGHDVTVIAPHTERSACSHSLNSMYAVTYKEETGYGYKAYSCTGTPADCVKLGVLSLLKDKPDLVLSGINNGTNLGSDVIYSGTVSAAFEGIYMGVPSIAVSTSRHAIEYGRIDEIAHFVLDNLDRLLALKLPATSAININYPTRQAIKGAKITPLGVHVYNDFFASVDGGYQLQGKPMLQKEGLDSDVCWYHQGYITITPVQNDRNDYATLKRIAGDFK